MCEEVTLGRANALAARRYSRERKKKRYIGGDVSPNRCSVPGKSRSRTKMKEEENSDLFPPAIIRNI